MIGFRSGQAPNISDLPVELVEEVLSRLPLTSLRGVRSACKSWNTLFKNESFTKKHIAQVAREVMAVVVIECQVFLIALDLRNPSSSVNILGQLISADSDPDRLDMSIVYHCDGLVLCITKDFNRCVVWNPYTCQTRWLEPRSPHRRLCWYTYAIGYQNKNCYKILRFVDNDADSFVEYGIYDLNSDSWRVLDAPTHEYEILYYARGVSLKGNTYWFAEERNVEVYQLAFFLVCFDFTAEKFGPRLALPFLASCKDTVALSSVRDEQLAVLFQPYDSLQMEIWVTAKIEPQVVSWTKLFLSVDMSPLTGFQIRVTNASFFIDQEKKLVVVFDKDKDVMRSTRNTAYVIGEDGYFKKVDIGESLEHYDYIVACSYVPSAVQSKQKEADY